MYESLQSDDGFGNPGSLHRLGVLAEKSLKASLLSISSSLQTKTNELYFTSCGSESINTAVQGFLHANPRLGKHIISTRTEHKASLETLRYLEDSGYEVSYLRVDRNGQPDLHQLEQTIRKDTALITLTHVNNETGAVLPVADILAVRNRTNAQTRIHLDCVQSLGKLPMRLSNLGIDMASFSGHKVHSVKGIGLLYVREGCKVHPLIYGGGQQNGLRSGTESPYLAGALALAISLAEIDRDAALVRVTMLKKQLIEALADLSPSILSPENALPYIVNLSFASFSAETMLHALEEQDIYVSTVSACSSKNRKVSHVLLEMGVEPDVARNAVRISFSRLSTAQEVAAVSAAIHQIFSKYSTKRGRS